MTNKQAVAPRVPREPRLQSTQPQEAPAAAKTVPNGDSVSLIRFTNKNELF